MTQLDQDAKSKQRHNESLMKQHKTWSERDNFKRDIRKQYGLD